MKSVKARKARKAGKAGKRHMWLGSNHKFNRLHAAMLIIAVVAAALLANQYYSPEFPGEVQPSSLQMDPLMCGAAADCVPAECCHPVSCVNRGNAPSCEGAMCTLDCRPGTMDCGYGSCGCVEGMCAAVMG